MSLSDEEVLGWLEMIERVTKVVAREFPDIDAEDVAHEMWVIVLSHPELDLENPGCYSLMRKKARDAAWTQRTEQLHMHSQYSYTKSDVKRILKTSLHYGDWAKGWTPRDAQSDDDPMGPVEVRSDIVRALANLKPASYKKAIIDCFQEGIDPETPADYARLDRAITKLVTLLNWYYDPQSKATHPGRQVTSNATAQWLTRQQTEGL